MAEPLRLIEGAMALDGGSIYLWAEEADGTRISFNLSWSIQAQREGQTSWTVNQRVIPEGSPEEAEWLDRIRGAIAVPEEAPPAEDKIPGPKRLMLLPPGDAAYFEAIDRGPEEALRALVARLIENVTSDRHQQKIPLNPIVKPRTWEEVAREFLEKGQRKEAMQVYRKAHPNASPADAKAAIEKLGE